MNTTNTNLYDMIKSKKNREKDTSASSSSSSPNDINMKRILTPLHQHSYTDSTKSKQLQDKKKKHLKPLFEEGDEVYAAYWADDKRVGDTPSWYPGKVKSYREDINDNDGSRREYGPLRLYSIEFDDGDEIDNLEDAYIFNKEDYLLTIRLEKSKKKEWIGVRNVVDEESSDVWARSVGWYVADINGEERPFSLLSDALRAYDAHVMQSSYHLQTDVKKYSQLNLPEEWEDIAEGSSNEQAELDAVVSLLLLKMESKMNEQEERHSKYIDQARIESARLEDKVQELTVKLEKAETKVLNDDVITRHVDTLTTQKAAADLENTNLKMQVEELTSKLKVAEKKAADDAAELELFKTYLQSARKSIMKYKLPSNEVIDRSSAKKRRLEADSEDNITKDINVKVKVSNSQVGGVLTATIPTVATRRVVDNQEDTDCSDRLQSPTTNDATTTSPNQSRADVAELVSPTSTSELGMTCQLYSNESSIYPGHYHNTWQYQQIMCSLQPLPMMGYNMYPMLTHRTTMSYSSSGTLLTPANHQFLLNLYGNEYTGINHIMGSDNM